MKFRYLSWLCLFLCMGMGQWLHAQQETECNPLEGLPVAKGEVNFVYGTTANAFSTINRSDIVVGQPLVGSIQSQPYVSDYGIWAVLRMAPQAPVVMPSQGDYPDRVLIEWSSDPLGPPSTEGFIITRDGAYLATVEAGNLEFIDFNVQAGEFYEYGVRGVNNFGQGVRGVGVGFVNPNGVVSGKITTTNGNPVPGTTVTLSPSIGNSLLFNGVSDNICISHNDALSTDMFTVSAWVKIGATHDSDGIIDLGSDLNKNFWIHTTPTGLAKGVVIGVGDGTAHEVTHEFVDDPNTVAKDERDDWHHVAAVYGGGFLLLYVDGKFVTSMQAPISEEAALFSIGSRRDQTGFFDGLLDDVRIYDRLLTQTELISTKDITASKLTEGLVAYWKFDEGLGSKVFDISNNNMDGSLNGTQFSDDTPEVKNGAMTDVTGYYFIEGINYSQEQVFQARPQKSFYKNYSLEFNAAYQSCAELTNFDLPDTSHIELTVHPFDLNRTQSILSKVQGGSDAFNLFLENGQYKLTINGETQLLGNATAAYQHLAFSLNATTGELTYYLDGNLVSTLTYADLSGTWNGEPWQLAAKGVATPTDFYTGLIDEVAFYADSLLSLADIQLHASQFGNGGTDIGHGNLLSYFNLNEGDGDELYDGGPARTGIGEVKNAMFSFITFRQDESPHEFEPNYRFININNSATAVSDVDFTDASTVPITGVVRFKNTFCYQDSVEILVNGESFFPPIFTNEDGRFVADFEPGANIVLTPKFGEGETAHQFFPAFFEARRLNVPIANVLFQNTTTREVEGQIFGGYCREQVIRANSSGGVMDTVWVKARTLNGCYEKQLSIDNVSGRYKFTGLPPLPMTIAVTRFVDANNPIQQYFSLRGGTQIDMREIEKDTVDFMYRSSPIIEYTPLESVAACGEMTPVLEFGPYQTKIKVYEDYEGGRCYLDTALLTFKDEIANVDGDSVLLMTGGEVVYKSIANTPNIVPPYTKKLEIRAETVIGSVDLTPPITAIVLGDKSRGDATFTSVSSPIIVDIIRDPPGDGSTATREAGTEVCGSIDVSVSDVSGEAQGFYASVAPTWEVGEGGIGFFVGREVSIVATTDNKWSHSRGYNNGRVEEVCHENVTAITTSEDLIGEEGDIYVGTTFNLTWGQADRLEWNDTLCEIELSSKLTIDPSGFNSQFMYTNHYITNNLVPELELLAANEPDVAKKDSLLAAALQWGKILAQEKARKNASYESFNDIFTFDAGVAYESSITYSGSEESTVGYEEEFSFENANQFGFFVNAIGAQLNLEFNKGRTTAGTQTRTEGKTTTYSYSLADDDIGDVFAVGVIFPNSNTITDGLELQPAQLEFEYINCQGNVYSTEYACINSGCDCTRRPLSANVANIVSQIDETFVGTGTESMVLEDLSNPLLPSHLPSGKFPAPIFKYLAGTTSCPWEGGRRRDKVYFSSDRTIASNVSMNNAAVFRLYLSNESPSEETREYKVKLVPGTNPDGAFIAIDGVSISSVPYTISVPYGETREVTMTIRKGPVAFDYEGIKISYYSDCEFDGNDAINGELDEEIYKELSFNVYFVEPCSNVEIGYPQEGHTITPGNEILGISLGDYNEDDPDLHYIAVQYRRIPGDGAWINITPTDTDTLFKADLDPVATIVDWDMTELQDATYQIRAVAFCYDLSLNPGISTFFTVFKETEPPSLFGNPEPADGLLVPGDEISITFNENIKCDQVFDADGIGTNINYNNIALINSETGLLVPFSHVCLDNKIIITPEVQNKFINGKTLRARATAIEDLAGNEMEVPIGAPGSPTENFKEWEFLVDLNPLRWEAGSNIEEVVEVGLGKTITRNIVNRGGSNLDYTIRGPRIDNPDGSVTYGDLPDWATIFPTEGTLEPGEVKAITFMFDESLPQNDYFTKINVVGTDGNKAIDLDLRVICPPPLWLLDPTQFDFSMNFTVELDIEGEMSEDKMDIVGAFVDNELRGMAYVQYEPDLDKYLAFLTVYSNVVSGESLDFQIWDADECLLYGEVLENFNFVLDGIVGSPLVPQVLHTNNQLLRKIPVHPGWNWISFNLNAPDKGINPMLASLEHPQGALMKGQTQFSQYHTGLAQWLGSLQSLSYKTMYQYKSAEYDTILHVGAKINPDTVHIPIQIGWNWIGYLPQESMHADLALASLSPLNGDVLKGQTTFAQYVAGLGWIGSLNFLSAPNGYLLRMSNPGVLTFPGPNLIGNGPVDQLMLTGGDQTAVSGTSPLIPLAASHTPDLQTLWTVDPTLFEHSMNLVAIVGADANLLEDGDVVGAFVGSEVRGGNEAIYVEPLQAWLVFLTAYANEGGEEMSFKYYDASAEDIHRLNEAIVFTPDYVQGTVEAPQVLTLEGENPSATAETSIGEWMEVYPNPASDVVYAAFGSLGQEAAVLRITDNMGRLVKLIDIDPASGLNIVKWETDGVANGTYFLTLTSGGSTLTRKVVKMY